MSIVNIGGVFYRCSPTSLTKRNLPFKQLPQKVKKCSILQISGRKFQLDESGQTLICLDKTPGSKRVDIGGVTFIGSSSGASLTRTNYHMARSILVQAKQKSIALLTRKLKKNNEPCPFYHRLGKCSGLEKGTCTRQHDPKHVKVCIKFVQGTCSVAECLLSHEISAHKMPTCQHFLAGHCGRDCCPYPHVKVSDAAPICLDFLKGYCDKGDQCMKRHCYICPSFEKGNCVRGKYCPYPHPKSKLVKTKRNKKLNTKSTKAAETVSISNLRYFEDLNLQQEKKIKLEKDEEEIVDPEDVEKDSLPLKSRPKLGRLPSYIPLNLEYNSDGEVE